MPLAPQPAHQKESRHYLGPGRARKRFQQGKLDSLPGRGVCDIPCAKPTRMPSTPHSLTLHHPSMPLRPGISHPRPLHDTF
eukprot:6079155-Pyramimonas_sp.AAC.1